MRRIGFPWSEFLIQRSLLSVGGTIRTMQLALQHGVALHLSGGYHHAFAAEGAGFCLFNDLAVAAAMALQQGVDKVLIFDCDVHQGDGCALIFADEPRVVTASLHGEKNFPARKQQSDWDIGLPTHCDDSQYLEALHQSLSYLLALHQPDLVLYDAGVDIHQDDDLGLLQISTAGIYQRDLQLFRACKDAQIPVAAVIGGGYQRNIQKLTVVHSQLFRAASNVWLPTLPLQWPDDDAG
jgi:acetoin utilization deacetylase AcuC-like enzyme